MVRIVRAADSRILLLYCCFTAALLGEGGEYSESSGARLLFSAILAYSCIPAAALISIVRVRCDSTYVQRPIYEDTHI